MKQTKLYLSGSFIVLGLLFVFYRLALGWAKFIPQPYQNLLSRINFSAQNIAANITDAFYPQTYWQERLVNKLSTLDLVMSKTDLENIDADARKSIEQGFTDKNAVNTQTISLVFDRQKYSVSINFHGGGANDFIFNKNDYNIKIKDGKNILGYASFNLFNPSVHHWLVPLLARRVADELNLIASDQFPVLVKINHKISGVYLFEEKVNDDFLTKKNWYGAGVIKRRDETRLPHRVNTVALNAHILSGFDWEIANVDPPGDNPEMILGRLDRFYKAAKNQDFESLKLHVDLDYMARFDAYRQVLGINHDTAGANLIMVFLPENNKFYPIARSEGDINRLAIEGGSSLKSYNNYDPHLTEQYDYQDLWLFLNRQAEFRLLKYRYLHQLLDRAEILKQNFAAIQSQTAPVFLYDTSDEASVWQKRKMFKDFIKTIDDNLKIIEKEVNFAQAAVNVISGSRQASIEIVPDSLMPVGFNSFVLEFNDGSIRDITEIIGQKNILAEFSDDYDLLPTVFSYTVPVSLPVKSVRVEAKNLITGKAIEKVYYGLGSN